VKDKENVNEIKQDFKMQEEKHKQIEEMAKDIETIEKEEGNKLLNETLSYVKKHHKYNSKEDYSLAHIKTLYELTAEKLYKQGYRKLPEDSVVLSREEYERLKHYEWRVTSGVCMTQKEWFDFCNEDSNRRTCLRIEEREKERKETAERLESELKAFIKVWKMSEDDAMSILFYRALFEKISELAKQFGVEIKE
jgi:hypothetical protein